MLFLVGGVKKRAVKAIDTPTSPIGWANGRISIHGSKPNRPDAAISRVFFLQQVADRAWITVLEFEGFIWQGMMPAVGIQLQLEYPNNFSDEVCVRGRFNAVSFDNHAWAHRPLSTSLFMARIGALVQARAFAAIFGAKNGGCLSAVP
jgi:hypothetical protein